MEDDYICRIMKRRILLLVTLLVCGFSAFGADSLAVATRHEIRLGGGDMMFETLIWNNQIHKDYSWSTPGATFNEKRNYVYSPHIAAEYAYHLLPWLSLGVMVDFQVTGWKLYSYDSKGREIAVTNENFTNLCILPTVRFNYFRREHVGLYSAISAGIDFNGGSEVDGFGRHVQLGLAADLRFIGVTLGNRHWWGYAELGGIYALRNKNCMYLMNSEIFRVGASYKF